MVIVHSKNVTLIALVGHVAFPLESPQVACEVFFEVWMCSSAAHEEVILSLIGSKPSRLRQGLMFELQNMLRIVERSTREEDKSRDLREEDKSRDLRMVGLYTCELRYLHVKMREAVDRGAVSDDKSLESGSMENNHERKITLGKQSFEGATANTVAVEFIESAMDLARRSLPTLKAINSHVLAQQSLGSRAALPEDLRCREPLLCSRESMDCC